MITLPAAVLSRYRRFTLYNSPYAAHDRGCAIDLYPGGPEAPSPVAGEVLDARTVRAPPKPYAAEHDHLILIDADGGRGSDERRGPAERRASDGSSPSATGYAEGRVARVLHVDPSVEPGDRVAVGDSLGRMVRSGFFAPWVDNHVHLGFREPDANLHRASGSLPLAVGVEVEPLPWDGTGTVVGTGGTYAVLDAPAHPAPGERFVGIAGRATGRERDGRVALDGGCPHYDGGGALPGADGPVELAGTPVGTANSRDVRWDEFAVHANGEPITGVSLFFARDADFGAKLICPDADFEAGEHVTVEIRRR